MAAGLDFAGMVPGFDFLQGLMKGAGAAMPPMGQWVAPTLDPAELDKRIGELKTVQFWLEQNAKLLGSTIQAMEVQRMTLATLQTMNLPLADLRDALAIKPPSAQAAAAASPFAAFMMPPVAEPLAEPVPEPVAAPVASGSSAEPAVDPMKWWGALTQQFTEIAAKAMQAGATDPSPVKARANRAAEKQASGEKAAAVKSPARKKPAAGRSSAKAGAVAGRSPSKRRT